MAVTAKPSPYPESNVPNNPSQMLALPDPQVDVANVRAARQDAEVMIGCQIAVHREDDLHPAQAHRAMTQGHRRADW